MTILSVLMESGSSFFSGQVTDAGSLDVVFQKLFTQNLEFRNPVLSWTASCSKKRRVLG